METTLRFYTISQVYMIMLNMSDQERSDLDVVFTMILCATTFLFGKL